jgi:FAD/FMN-containing dehydrogenase
MASPPPGTTPLSIPKLRTDINGQVIAPDDPEYDEARTVFPGGIDRRPAVIVRVADGADVSRVVDEARQTGLDLAIRGGGHSLFGVCDGGIVLDLSRLRGLDIDVQGRTAWAQAGLTAVEYSKAVAEHGLATGFGDTGSVGIGGITLGGGVGYLVRKFGLTIDDLLAAEIVTADGELLQVDEENHPDLFWALRGGGGNFGVVTRFRLRLHELPTVVGGMLLLPATPEVIASFIAEAEAAPEELTTIANVMPTPPMPFVPAEQHGRLSILALMCYAGAGEDAERALAPFRALATPIADMVQPIPYPAIYPPEDETYHPVAAGRTLFVDAVDRGSADTIVEHIGRSSGMMAVAQLRVLGGAMARVPDDATAFAHRGRRIMVNVAALYQDPDEAAVHEAWATEFASALNNGAPGAYVNFLNEDGEARIREAYPEPTWSRLAAVKARYDPTNLFRLNQNIPPATRG